MPSGQRELSVAQQSALDELARVDLARRRLEMEIDAEQRIERKRRIDSAYTEVAIATRRAVGLKIPKMRIAKEGLHTSFTGQVGVFMDRISHLAVGNTELEIAALSWANEARTQIRVHFPLFPTTSKAEDYPKVLEGVVRVLDNNRFEVVEDASDEVTTHGAIPGFLRWEIEYGTLPAMLTEWLGQNR